MKIKKNIKSKQAIFANFHLPTAVQMVLDGYSFSVRDPVHPVVRQHVFVTQLGSKVVLGQSTYERAHGHRLSNGMEIQSFGVEPQNGSTGLLSSDLGFPDAVVALKNDAGAPDNEVFDGLVQVLVIFVKQGKIGVDFSRRREEELTRYAGYRNSGFEDVNPFFEVKLLERFHSLDKGLDVQVVVPDEEVMKGGHLVVPPHFLTKRIFFLRNVGAFQRAVEGDVVRE